MTTKITEAQLRKIIREEHELFLSEKKQQVKGGIFSKIRKAITGDKDGPQGLNYTPSGTAKKVNSGVKVNEKIKNAWEWLSPILPDGARMTSGGRTQADQERIIRSYAKRKGYKGPDDLDAMHAFTKKKGLIIARRAGTGHGSFEAMDISGAPLEQIEAAVNAASADPDIPVTFSPFKKGVRNRSIVEPNNNAVHVGIVKASPVDTQKIAQVISKYTGDSTRTRMAEASSEYKIDGSRLIEIVEEESLRFLYEKKQKAGRGFMGKENVAEPEEDASGSPADIAKQAHAQIGGRKETDPEVASIIKRYWLRAFNGNEKKAASFLKARQPWSAVFIVNAHQNTPGMPKDARGHVTYMQMAKKGEGGMTAKKPTEVEPKPGDLVCRPRGKKCPDCDGYHKVGSENHCDVFVGGGQMIGGNLGDTSKKIPYSKDKASMIIQMAEGKKYAISKKRLEQIVKEENDIFLSEKKQKIKGGGIFKKAREKSPTKSGDAGGAQASKTSGKVESSAIGGNIVFKLSVGENPTVLYFYPGVGYGTQPYVNKVIKGMGVGNNTIIILAKKNSTPFSSLKATAQKALAGSTPGDTRLGGWSGGAVGLSSALKSGDNFSRVIYADPSPGSLIGKSHGNAKMYYNPKNWKGSLKHLGTKQEKLAAEMGGSAKLVGSDHNKILKDSLSELLA
jgi:hypothetical protein